MSLLIDCEKPVDVWKQTAEAQISNIWPSPLFYKDNRNFPQLPVRTLVDLLC